MHVRKTTSIDVEAVDTIYKFAKARFKELGIDQWQHKYPDADTVREDVEAGIGYVLEHEGQIVGAVALTMEPEETYREIYDGSWLTEGERYVTVHRIAVAGATRGQGYSKPLMEEAEKLARQIGFPSVKVDTHPDNKIMQALLERCGYTHCGMIKLTRSDEAGSLRMCYEKMV